ncbi:MAG: FISUMP domain-containing protein [Candidatus Gracilibacteria bacterium]|nr:FISUMP domain-containing protein [Candidatus Gracilibacteria bacterium]
MKTHTEIKKHLLKNIYGFSLIELLVSVSILATISIVSYVSYAGYIKTANNTTRIETIDSLHLSLSDYYQMKKTLPEPNSNYISYDERGTYTHSLSGAYGISGYVSNNFLPAGYLNFQALDPESKQFYGYGKLTDNTAFDVAATLYDETTGGYKTYLRGTYEKTRLSSLIRSYSSSNFVSQDSTENLPYNPYERKVTAYISSYSGTVTLHSSLSLTGELNSGDVITVATGSTALLHISDGSELSLGSTESQTELSLSSLKYNDDNNLASRVVLILTSGEVWTEAPHYRTEMDSPSDFSIQTDSALAAVRGTVFGVSKNPTGVTTFSLASGKLEVAKLDTTGKETPFTQNFNTTTTEGFVIDNAKSYMIVPDGGQAIKLDGIANRTDNQTIQISTGTIDQSTIDTKIQHPRFSLGYRPKADNISFTKITDSNGTITQTGTLSVTFQNPGADSYRLTFGTGDVTDATFLSKPNPEVTGILDVTQTLTTITGAFAYISDTQVSRTYTFQLCFRGECSAPDIKVLGGSEFSFDNFRIWGEEKKIDTKVSTGNWKDIDRNCFKSDIIIGSQTWAGCNSTIGSIGIQYLSGTTQSPLNEVDVSGNLYGALYQWNVMNTNTCFGTGISIDNTTCPCKGGYHIPSDTEWTNLETILGSSTGSNLGWNSNNSNSLKNKLGFTLAGYCVSGSACMNREEVSFLSTTMSTLILSMSKFSINSDLKQLSFNNNYINYYNLSVRCLKD